MKLYKHIKIILGAIIVLAANSCKQTDEFINPVAKMSISATTITIPDKLEVINLGNGQRFAFWTGDEGHNYNKKDLGNDFGFPPNAGNDFDYYYRLPGTYTLVMIATSYDATSGKFVQKIDSAKIVVNGNLINDFIKFGIKNCFTNYNPTGFITQRTDKNDSILIKIVSMYYPKSLDSIAAVIYIQNSLPACFFTVNEDMQYVTVTDENSNVYKGTGSDVTIPKWFTAISKRVVVPDIHTFSITDKLSGDVHNYKVAAMFYPELDTISFDGVNALMFSSDGFKVDVAASFNGYYYAHADSLYVGVPFVDNPKSTVPTFNVSPDCTVTYNGQTVTSGVTAIDLTVMKKPVLYINREYQGFKITTKVAVNYSVF